MTEFPQFAKVEETEIAAFLLTTGAVLATYATESGHGLLVGPDPRGRLLIRGLHWETAHLDGMALVGVSLSEFIDLDPRWTP